MNMPPVQGLSQPYTWPIPTGTDLNSFKVKDVHLGDKADLNICTFLLLRLKDKSTKDSTTDLGYINFRPGEVGQL